MKTFSQTGSSADPAGCVEPTVIQAVLDVPVCLLFLQLCVSKCPDRFVTYTDVQASYRYKCDQWNYFKQFCKPGFNSPLQDWKLCRSSGMCGADSDTGGARCASFVSQSAQAGL
ncbi:choline transporter-like protein 5-B isoform 2-T22 [Amazona ochrocephala]